MWKICIPKAMEIGHVHMFVLMKCVFSLVFVLKLNFIQFSFKINKHHKRWVGKWFFGSFFSFFKPKMKMFSFLVSRSKLICISEWTHSQSVMFVVEIHIAIDVCVQWVSKDPCSVRYSLVSISVPHYKHQRNSLFFWVFVIVFNSGHKYEFDASFLSPLPMCKPGRKI